ncbi:MAG: lysostaphin resistance A-like protein, partial [Candidatus Sericytochromatia bacterium]
TIKTLKEIIVPLYFFILLSIFLFFVSLSYKNINNNEKFELIQQNQFSLVTMTDVNSIIHNILILFLACFIGPIVEEIFFRGFLLSRLAIRTNLKDAMISSSIVFGLLHGISFIWISILGYILANIYIRNKSLVYPILAHILYNFIVIFTKYFFNNNNINDLFFNYYLLFIVASIFISISSLYLLDQFFKDSAKKIEELKELPYFENYKKYYGEDIIFINDDLE